MTLICQLESKLFVMDEIEYRVKWIEDTVINRVCISNIAHYKCFELASWPIKLRIQALRASILSKSASRILKEVLTMVCDNINHQVHPSSMNRSRQRNQIIFRAEVWVYRVDILRPIPMVPIRCVQNNR